jgi:hypothetical protein
MRVFICVIPLLCGCSTPLVRCDVHLLPINPPATAVTTTPPEVAIEGSTP